MVAGANEAGYHLRNTNLGRDYQADIIADIAQAEDGAPCPQCGGKLEPTRRGSGNIFSWAPAIPNPWVRPSWMRKGKRTRSSWAPTASAWVDCWPVWPKNITTRWA